MHVHSILIWSTWIGNLNSIQKFIFPSFQFSLLPSDWLGSELMIFWLAATWLFPNTEWAVLDSVSGRNWQIFESM